MCAKGDRFIDVGDVMTKAGVSMVVVSIVYRHAEHVFIHLASINDAKRAALKSENETTIVGWTIDQRIDQSLWNNRSVEWMKKVITKERAEQRRALQRLNAASRDIGTC